MAASPYPTLAVHRWGSHPFAFIATVSVDLRLEKDRWRGDKVRIRREGKIKACGTTARDWSRFHCLHIGLLTADTVPRIRNQARQHRVMAASIGAFPQCHQGSFASGGFAVSLGAWLAPTMIHAFALALAARAAEIIGGCWRQRRSSARSLVPAPSHDHPWQRHLSVRGASPICRPSAAGAQPSRAGERPHHGAGRRRGPERAVSSSRRAT